MMRFSLAENPPEAVEVNGIEHPVNWDFRSVLQVRELFHRAQEGEESAAYAAFSLFYRGAIPDDAQGAAEALMEFLRGGQSGQKRTRTEEEGEQSTPDANFSFETDGALIYAAFEEQYGIDLFRAEPLHWWKFLALFYALENTLFTEVCAARRERNTSGLPAHIRNRYAYLRRTYPLERADQGEIDRLNELLSRGEAPNEE